MKPVSSAMIDSHTTLRNLSGGITVRQATKGESLTLLDAQQIDLDEKVLVIADHEKPVALAGIMGGLESGVTDKTQAIFLESAFFAPAHLAGQARRYGLHTDASLRFERGVDSAHQERALDRATELLLEIAGGSAGPVTEVASAADLPASPVIRLFIMTTPVFYTLKIITRTSQWY